MAGVAVRFTAVVMAALQTFAVVPSVDVDSAASGIKIGVVGAVVRAGGLPVDVVAAL